jgi:hypothetical protein
MIFLASKFMPKIRRERFMLELNEDIPNKRIFCVCGRVLLIDLEFEEFDCIKE